MMLGSLFDPEIPFERVSNGPNTMMTLPVVPPRVEGTLQKVKEVLRHQKKQSNCPKFILAMVGCFQ